MTIDQAIENLKQMKLKLEGYVQDPGKIYLYFDCPFCGKSHSPDFVDAINNRGIVIHVKGNEQK